MGLFEFTKGVRYRIRIFDNSNFIMSADVADKGQRKFEVTVHKGTLGFGEKIKLAYMLNPKIKPKIFDGKIFEVDFDIRDSVQLGDLMDIAPEIVKDVNDAFYKQRLEENRQKDDVVDAEYSVKNADDLFEETEETAPRSKSAIEIEEEEDARIIDTIFNAGKDTINAVTGLTKLKQAEGKDKKQKIQDLLNIAARHPKLLYWLPGRIDIEPEITALVSQSMIYRTGIQPSYYIAQSNAMISEKTLARPKEQTGWQQVVMMAIVGVLILGTLGIVAYILTK